MTSACPENQNTHGWCDTSERGGEGLLADWGSGNWGYVVGAFSCTRQVDPGGIPVGKQTEWWGGPGPGAQSRLRSRRRTGANLVRVSERR